MRKGPIRRGQLITTFGVGALSVTRDGTSLICASLDHWYERETNGMQGAVIEEFFFNEWRMERMLGVDHFRLPPDWRKRKSTWHIGQDSPALRNEGLTIPFLRFPLWHFCPACRTLIKLHPNTIRPDQCASCPQNKKGYPIQVPFVVMCDNGHIQDFPWVEWVHESAEPSCTGRLRLHTSGGAGLHAQKVVCDECKAARSLSRITQARSDGTSSVLSEELSKNGEAYLCRGSKIWTGSSNGQACGRPLWGTLRNALNVYYSDIRSAIFLPEKAPTVEDDVMDVLSHSYVDKIIRAAKTLSRVTVTHVREEIRLKYPVLVEKITDDRLEEGIAYMLQGKPTSPQATTHHTSETIKMEEYNTLKKRIRQYELEVEPLARSEFQNPIHDYFTAVSLVPRLQETRVLNGFSRVYQENAMSDEQKQGLLWDKMPQSVDDRWLPAIQVRGEGIFLELNIELVMAWESRIEIIDRTALLEKQYQQFCHDRRLPPRTILPREVLVHTLAHLLINRLVFECGYGSASLRERLYIANRAGTQMCGVLIYTAAGDSDGTLGGLVRIGRPGPLERVLQNSLDAATWCSSDPVCMEMGHHGQGPDSCNLAACHNCALIPETACEKYNRFLDRGLVIGDPTLNRIGFFEECLTS